MVGLRGGRPVVSRVRFQGRRNGSSMREEELLVPGPISSRKCTCCLHRSRQGHQVRRLARKQSAARLPSNRKETMGMPAVRSRRWNPMLHGPCGWGSMTTAVTIAVRQRLDRLRQLVIEPMTEAQVRIA